MLFGSITVCAPATGPGLVGVLCPVQLLASLRFWCQTLSTLCSFGFGISFLSLISLWERFVEICLGIPLSTLVVFVVQMLREEAHYLKFQNLRFKAIIHSSQIHSWSLTSKQWEFNNKNIIAMCLYSGKSLLTLWKVTEQKFILQALSQDHNR